MPSAYESFQPQLRSGYLPDSSSDAAAIRQYQGRSECEFVLALAPQELILPCAPSPIRRPPASSQQQYGISKRQLSSRTSLLISERQLCALISFFLTDSVIVPALSGLLRRPHLVSFDVADDMTGRRRVRIPNPPEGEIPPPHGGSQAASTFDELLVYLRHSAKQSGFSIVAPAKHQRLTPSPINSRLLLWGDTFGELANGRALTSCTWRRAQAFRGDRENGWVWQLIDDIHDHGLRCRNRMIRNVIHDIGRKASAPMADQAGVALLEANLGFGELHNFDYWFAREQHPETEECLHIRHIRPAYIRSSLLGEGMVGTTGRRFAPSIFCTSNNRDLLLGGWRSANISLDSSTSTDSSGRKNTSTNHGLSLG